MLARRSGPRPRAADDLRALRGFADRPVRATCLDRSRADAWLEVRTIGYWPWCLEAGLTEDPLRCARIVTALVPRA